MRTITLARKAVKRNDDLISYSMNVKVIAANDITSKVFVKQRIKKHDGTIDDVFSAVASPANLEDIDENSPNAGSSYFRTDNATLVSSDPGVLDEAFDIILREVQLLVDQVDALTNTENDGVYTISGTQITAPEVPEGVDVNSLQVHQYAGDPNDHVWSASPAICLDTTNSKMWWKTDGVSSSTGWY